jgi:hypothetical protein
MIVGSARILTSPFWICASSENAVPPPARVTEAVPAAPVRRLVISE